MSDKIDIIVKKECPYCSELFVVDEDGRSDDFMYHLLEQHKGEIESDYDVFDRVVEENWDDLINDYEYDIRGVFLFNEDDIVINYGEDLIHNTVDDLISNAVVKADQD